jgi:hypothetical protein
MSLSTIAVFGWKDWGNLWKPWSNDLCSCQDWNQSPLGSKRSVDQLFTLLAEDFDAMCLVFRNNFENLLCTLFWIYFKNLAAWGNKHFGMWVQPMKIYLSIPCYRGRQKWMLCNLLNILTVLNLHVDHKISHQSLFVIFHAVIRVVLLFFKH